MDKALKEKKRIEALVSESNLSPQAFLSLLEDQSLPVIKAWIQKHPQELASLCQHRYREHYQRSALSIFIEGNKKHCLLEKSDGFEVATLMLPHSNLLDTDQTGFNVVTHALNQKHFPLLKWMSKQPFFKEALLAPFLDPKNALHGQLFKTLMHQSYSLRYEQLKHNTHEYILEEHRNLTTFFLRYLDPGYLEKSQTFLHYLCQKNSFDDYSDGGDPHDDQHRYFYDASEASSDVVQWITGTLKRFPEMAKILDPHQQSALSYALGNERLSFEEIAYDDLDLLFDSSDLLFVDPQKHNGLLHSLLESGLHVFQLNTLLENICMRCPEAGLLVNKEGQSPLSLFLSLDQMNYFFNSDLEIDLLVEISDLNHKTPQGESILDLAELHKDRWRNGDGIDLHERLHQYFSNMEKRELLKSTASIVATPATPRKRSSL